MSTTTTLSKCTVFPAKSSSLPPLKLSVSDLPMLSTHYIQTGCLFTRPPFPLSDFIYSLKSTLAQTLTHFPPLAGRFITDSDGYVYITCNDAGALFIHAANTDFCVSDIARSPYVPEVVREFFAFDRTLCYQGHFHPLLAVQVTELADGVFIGFAVNHAVTDGTSFWHFINTFAEVTRGEERITQRPDFSRDSVFISPAVLNLPAGGPQAPSNLDAPVRERIFSFSRESILKLKASLNDTKREIEADGTVTEEISSFQSICALLWRAVTRGRKLPASKTTTFRMAVNCRHRLEPNLDPLYFGNAIQVIPTPATAGDVLSHDPRWCAEQLSRNVKAYGNAAVRKRVADWERDPQLYPMGNPDGATITIVCSPRFPMYDSDFGWGRPVAVRSGRANKFDGKISAFPGQGGGGGIDLEAVLAPETMASVESDPEIMQYISGQ